MEEQEERMDKLEEEYKERIESIENRYKVSWHRSNRDIDYDEIFALKTDENKSSSCFYDL